ncbi:phosphatidylinositol 4-kinase gamma 3 [Ricinus communis]|uniref:1-phosphatidylinositol 4-kinase n=1 Tax=Ricinus communis TaxID=3988 RepID=B9RSH8_RICCO|nr:phosphatidylinositol 4-kinase gamma 3 [Ricinus communis]EEF45716.1 ubiquitin, putative [Ricinus communis]|eukprot:XP_002516697.1 phosphatidylinositol 4-kinase gamma 3 [Ricinus communis]
MASVALSTVNEESLNLHCNLARWHGPPRSNDSILIFLSVAGSLIPMHVMESDSIASVKLRIQASKGFFVKKQKLVFEGRELARSNSHVRDYGVADGKVLHLVLRLSDLQAITVRTVCGKEFKFHVQRGRNVGYVKQQISKKGKGFNLIDQELICDGEELEDQRIIDDICKSNDSVIHLLVRKSAKVRTKTIDRDFELSIEALDLSDSADCVVGEHQKQALALEYRALDRKPLLQDFILEPLIVNFKVELPLVLKKLINSTSLGLERGNEPIRSSEGSGGAYFMQDSSGHKYVSVFKPVDEEPMAVNNPRGLPVSVNGEGLKKGTRVGGGALREVAAYILDYPKNGPRLSWDDEKGFAGVPPTVMIKCLHKAFNHPDGYKRSLKNIKIGSLQMFVENSGSCEDMGPRAFPVDEVHKISVLDIRLANADRHAGNILVTKDGNEGKIALIPIDHGYCLPENFEDCTFDWLYWPQAQQPYPKEILDYIKDLDAEQDIALLKFHGWDIPPSCARTLRISTMLLKKGAKRGLTPFAIGSIMCRETMKKESAIERIIQEAQDAVLPESSEAAFLECVASIMDHRLDELSQ